MNRLFARIMTGVASLVGADPIIRDYPLRRRPLDPIPLGPPSEFGKPGGRSRRVLGHVGGRFVMIDEQRLALLHQMPRAKARHWLAHNRTRFSYARAPAT